MLDAFNLPSQSYSTLGLYYDTKNKVFGGFNVQSFGDSIILDAQGGFEFGVSPLSDSDYFSRDTSTAEVAAFISESVVVDNNTGEIVATETGISISVLGKFLTPLLGKAASKFFSMDLAGRQDSTIYRPFIDFNNSRDRE